MRVRVGWKRSDYQLFQDGERRSTPASWPAYRALLERLPADAAGPATLPVLTPLGEQDALPTEIRQNLGQCEKRLAGREDISVSVGRDGKGRYVIAIASSKTTMHMAFETQRRSGRKGAGIASTNSVRVVTADGKDLTEEIEGKLNGSPDSSLSLRAQAPPKLAQAVRREHRAADHRTARAPSCGCRATGVSEPNRR
jgi:hypothetical protein